MADSVFDEGKKQGEAYAVEAIAVTAANKSSPLAGQYRQADPDFLLGFYEGIIVTLKKFVERHKGFQIDEDEAEEAD